MTTTTLPTTTTPTTPPPPWPPPTPPGTSALGSALRCCPTPTCRCSSSPVSSQKCPLTHWRLLLTHSLVGFTMTKAETFEPSFGMIIPWVTEVGNVVLRIAGKQKTRSYYLMTWTNVFHSQAQYLAQAPSPLPRRRPDARRRSPRLPQHCGRRHHRVPVPRRRRKLHVLHTGGAAGCWRMSEERCARRRRQRG